MSQKFINDPEDMRWLRDVHLPNLSPKYKSAIITGNEDWPDKIEVYVGRNPTVTDRPLVYKPDSEGKFHLSRRNRRTRKAGPRRRMVNPSEEFSGLDFFPEQSEPAGPVSPQTSQLIKMEKMFGGYGYIVSIDQVLRDPSLVPDHLFYFWPAKRAWYIWSGKNTRAEAQRLGKKVQRSLFPENHPKQTMPSIHKDVLYVGYPGGHVALKPIKVKAMPPTREAKAKEWERRRISSLLEHVESGADPAAWRENPSGKRGTKLKV